MTFLVLLANDLYFIELNFRLGYAIAGHKFVPANCISQSQGTSSQ
jgi:hypothetical protein